MHSIEFLPAEGFEPPTNGLQNRCSTTELSRHRACKDRFPERGRELYPHPAPQGSFGVPATVVGTTGGAAGAGGAGAASGLAAG